MMLSMMLLTFATIVVNGQNYHSKPTAIKNLADESKYLTATIPSLEDSNYAAHLRNKEKQRFIKNILRSLKQGATVEEAVTTNLPSNDYSQLSVGVQNVALESGEKDKVKWIRDEILNLVSY